MKQHFGKTVFLALCSALLFAQGSAVTGSLNVAASTCATAGACIALPLAANIGSATITVKNTYVGTVQFETTGDGSDTVNGPNWGALSCTLVSDGTTSASSTTTTGEWTCPASSQTAIRVRMSAYTSGAAIVTIQTSIASARSGRVGATGPTGPTGATGSTGATGNNGTDAVAGSDTQVQFNDGGVFGASSKLTFTKGSGLLGVQKILMPTAGGGGQLFQEVQPPDTPTSPNFQSCISTASSAGSTTPDNFVSSGWNMCGTSSSWPAWGLVMERMWHPGGSGDAAAATVAINAAGTGYAVGDYVVIVKAASDQNAILRVLTVSGGAVTSVGIYQAGSAYGVASALATLPATQPNSGRYGLQTGSGTGLTINILTIGAPYDGGLESYFQYYSAGGGNWSFRPFGFQVNYATNDSLVSFQSGRVTFLTEDNRGSMVTIATTRGLGNSGNLTINGSALATSFTNSGNSFLNGTVTAGGTVITTASGSSAAGFRLTEGTAPASPAVGDMWLLSSGNISYRSDPGPSTQTIATDNNTLTFTGKSMSASQVTAQTFAAGAFSFSGSSLGFANGGSFDANGVLTLPTSSTTREYLNLGSGTKPTSPATGGVWMANSGTYHGLGYKGPSGNTWSVLAVQDTGVVNGDTVYWGSAWTRLAGPTTTVPNIMTSTGTGSAANAPAWTPAAWVTTTPTGSGNLVLQTKPTLVNPSLGAVSATATVTSQFVAAAGTQSAGTLQVMATRSGVSGPQQQTGSTYSGLMGFSINGNSNAGQNAEISQLGGVSALFDGSTTAGDYVIASTTSGDVHDAGATYPSDPTKQVLGRVLSTNTCASAPCTYTMWQFPGEVRGVPVAASDLSNGVSGSGAIVLASALPLTGTTGSIGGGLLTVGTCTSGTASVTGATTSMAVSASPVTYPGDGNYWVAYVSSSNTVTVKVCATATLTPTTSTYNVRVLQ